MALNEEQYNVLTQLFNEMSEEQKSSFYAQINIVYNDNAVNIGSKENYIKDNHLEIICPKCGSKHIFKNGKRNGRQRFICADCNKSFGYTEKTIIKYAKITLKAITDYIQCFLSKKSLRSCAEICKISLPTAFAWRHKILDSLQVMQERVMLNGIVESDETFTAISKKGDRHLTRKAHKRGHIAKLRGLSKEKVCLSCFVNHNGRSIGGYSNLGKPRWNEIDSVINKRIEAGSVFVTDSYKGYSRISYGMGLNHIRIAKDRHTNGVFNIQLINNYHRRLKELINRIFNGVATKYINNYIVYNNYVNFAKGTKKWKAQSLLKHLFMTVFVPQKRVIV